MKKEDAMKIFDNNKISFPLWTMAIEKGIKRKYISKKELRFA